jgi:hypothetical protein
MHSMGYDHGQLRFMAYRLASVIRMLDRPRLLNLQMAQLVRIGLRGAFPGIKMRSHDTNRVHGRQMRSRYTTSQAVPSSRVDVEAVETLRSNLNTASRCADRETAPLPWRLRHAQNIYRNFSSVWGADDNSLLTLGASCSNADQSLQSYRSPGYCNAELSRPPTALT